MARERPCGELVASHGDLDPKNALVTAEGDVVLVDWDAAGGACAGEDLCAVLLDWSGFRHGATREPIVEALLGGYRRVRRLPDLDPAAWIEAQLGWLAYNLERASDEDGEAAASARTELDYFFGSAERLAADLPRLLDSWRGVR